MVARREVIAVDGGGGGQRFRGQLADGTIIDREYVSFTLGEGSLTENYLERFTHFVREGFTSIERVVMAVAALPGSVQGRRDLAHSLLKVTGAQELWLTSDIAAAHFATIKGDGLVTTVGTGVGAIAVGKNRTRLHEISGDSYLIGDEGSAFWMGKMGLNRALRHKDGRGGSEALLREALKFYETDADSLADFVTALDRPVYHIAQFAPLVTTLAEAGDPSATEIVELAVDEFVQIAVTARRVLEAGEEFHIVYSGGAIPEDGVVYTRLQERLHLLDLSCEYSDVRNIEGAFDLAFEPDPGVYHTITEVVRA